MQGIKFHELKKRFMVSYLLPPEKPSKGLLGWDDVG